MEFPVDRLTTVDPETLEKSGKDYMSKLLYRNAEIHEYLNIPGSNKIEIGLCNVSFVPLYGVDIKQKVLALFSPKEHFKAVGFYLLDQWWSAEDILKTADSSRTGLIKVRTPGERIVLYVLNRIIYRMKEMARDDVPFLCHGEDEIAKILWKNGEAIGFYSVKPEGRLCKSFLTQRYQLPVMDTIFIRKRHRGNGHGLQILKDFVDSFKKDFIGLKYPLSPAMYKVCKTYLSLYPEDQELLWEIEGVGSPFQRTQIARKLQAMDLKGNQQVIGKLNFDTEDSDIPMEVGVTQVQETMEYTEVVEEVVQIKIIREVQDTPVAICSRSSNLKHKKLGADTEETAENIIRVEDIEPDVQCPEDDSVHDDGTLSKDTMETMTHDVTPISAITHLHCEEQNKLTAEPTYQSEREKEHVVEISPVMEIQSLKGNEYAHFLKSVKSTVVPVESQSLELQQVVEVEIVTMSSETDAVKEKAVEFKEIKDVNKEIPLDGSEPSEEVVETQKDQTDIAETTNKEDLGDEVEMGKISVVDNILDDTEEIEVQEQQAGALEVSLEEKVQSEQVKECFNVQECLCEQQQETEDQEPSPDNEEEKQEENSNMAYSSDSKGKHGDKQRSRRSRRLNDQATESELTERVLRSSSKKTLKATSNQVCIKQVGDEPKEEGLNQTESQVELPEKEQVGEIAENEYVEGNIESVSIMCIVSKDNEEGINVEKDVLDQQTTDDQNLMKVKNKIEDSSQDENKMDENLRKEEQEKVTAAVEEVAKTTEDGKEIGIVDVSNTEASEIMHDGNAPEPSAAEHTEEQEEEPASEPVPAEDDNNTQAALKWQKAAVTLGEPTEKQQVVEMADNENVVVVEDRIKNRNIEETEERHDKIEIKENITSKNENTIPLTDKNKMQEAQEEEPMKQPNTVQSEEPKINDIESSLDYEVGKTKDDEKIAVFDVHYAEDVNAAEIEVEGNVKSSAAEPVEEQEEEPTLEMVPAQIVQSTEEATYTSKLQKVAVLVDLNKVSTTYTDAREDAKGASEPESTDDREKNEADGLNQKVEPNEKEQEVEMKEKGNVTVEVMDKIQKSGIEETEEMMETEERVITTDVDRVSELTTDENKMEEFQEEETLTETKTVQDTPDEEVKSKDITDSSEDGEGVKSDDQIELKRISVRGSEEEKDTTNFITPLRCSRRLKHQAAERELTKSVLRTSTRAVKATSKPKTIKEQVKTKQAVDDSKSDEMKEIVELNTRTAVEEKIESILNESSLNYVEEDRNVDEEPLEENLTDYQNLMEVENKTEDVRPVEIEVKRKSLEPFAAEQQEEPASETVPAEDGNNTEEATSTLNLQNVAVVIVDFNKIPPKHESDDSEMDKGTSQPQEEVVQELKPQSTDHRNEGEGVNQTECEAELSEIEQEVEMTENKHEETEEVRNEKIEIEEELKSGAQIELSEEEEDETSFVTSLRRSRRLKYQVAESELTKRVQVKMKQPVDDPELEQMKEVLESHTESAVEEKSESVSITTEMEHMKAVEIEFEEKTPGQPAAEPVKEQEEGPASETGPAEDNTVEATSGLKLQKVEVVLFSTRIDAVKDAKGTSQSQEEVDLELHNPESTDTESQAEHVEKEQVIEMTESLFMESHEGAVLNDEDGVPVSAVTDKGNMEEVQKDTDTAQEIQAEEPRSLHVIESSEDDDGERSDVSDKLDEEDEASLITPLRRSRRLKDQVRESELRRSARLTNKATPQQRHKQSKNDEMNILMSEVAIGDHMESETVHVFAEGDPENMISAVQSTCEEGAVELGTDNMLITNDEQDRDILAEGGDGDYLKEVEDIILKEKSTSAELDTNKTLKENKESTTPSQGDSVQESTQDESISVCTAKNLRRRMLPEKASSERKYRHLQNIYKETKENENTEGESSDEVATVFTRHLRRRTVTVTPRRRLKHLTGTQVAELKMEAHVAKVCHEKVAVHSTEEARNAAEATHETNSKCNSEEVSAVSEAVRKDQQQDKNIPGNDAEKVEEVTDRGKDIVEDAVETTDREILVEVDLPDDNQEKNEPDEPDQEQVRSEYSEQESDQQHNALEETLLKKDLGKRVEEKHLEEAKDRTMIISITEAVIDESEDGVSVERRALRKRTITDKAASVRKSKRLRKQDRSENNGQTVVWANAVEATVMEMADVKSPTEKETTDQGKGQEVEDTNTIGRDIAHKEGEETSGNTSNSKESTVTEDISKQAQLSEFLNVSEEDTDTKLVAQEEEKGEENRQEHLTEEILESENNAGKADKAAGELNEFEDTQEEPEQSEKNAEGMTEAMVTVDENFTLELDEEINSNDAECNQVVGETKVSFRESEKQITDAEQESGVLTKCVLRGRKQATGSPEQRSARRSRGLLQDSQSDMKDKSEEVKGVIGEEETKHQQKRKAIVEPTPRRSKRLARAEIL